MLHKFKINQNNFFQYRLPLPGITVGDMGCKHGFNAIDNGYLIMDQVRIPRTYLLNKSGDVTEDGRYVTPFKNNKQRHGSVLGVLSGGRIAIGRSAAIDLGIAVTIATRYAFHRKQFGPPGGEEIPIIDYPMHQWRLMPYLASSFVLQNFAHFFEKRHVSILLRSPGDADVDYVANEGKEMHAVSCAWKPVASWTAQRGIQEMREACGGHGYLSVNRIGFLRNINDPRLTYEGDNNVILMQTSSYLLNVYKRTLEGKNIESPLGTVNFLTDIAAIRTRKCSVQSFNDITAQFVEDTFQWLVVHLLEQSTLKLQQQQQLDGDDFTARNNSQVYHCRSLALVYMENAALERFGRDLALNPLCPEEMKIPLLNLYILYGLWSMEKHLPLLFQGGYLTNGQQVRFIKEAIVTYCSLVKQHALAFVDAMAPPDWALNAPIGMKKGEPLKNLYDAMVTEKSQKRVDWWKELTVPVDPGSKSHLLQSQL